MVKSVQKVAVLGAGSWGTAFAKVLADTARENQRPTQVTIWGRNSEAMAKCQQTHTNEQYFPRVDLPQSIVFTAEMHEAITNADVIVVALPSQVIRSQLTQALASAKVDAIFVSLAKGLEQGTGLRMSQVITEVLAENFIASGIAETPEVAKAKASEKVAVLSGPNLAKEIVICQPTASVIAAADIEVAETVAELCASTYFRPYTATDVVGVEVGGLGKNVIALCVGICAGLGYGDNSKASIMTRGLAEMTRLAAALGADPLTMSGLAGMGDLIATCSSPLSRNHTAGKLLASGIAPDKLHTAMTQTAEAVKSGPILAELARELGVEMPITQAVTAILQAKISIDQLAPLLLGRSLKSENAALETK